MPSYKITSIQFASLPDDHKHVRDWRHDIIHLEGDVPDDGESAAHIIAEMITKETGHYVTGLDIEEHDPNEGEPVLDVSRMEEAVVQVVKKKKPRRKALPPSGS